MQAEVDLKLFLDKNTSILKKHIELLKAIDEVGSITAAAKKVGISYKNAWDSLDEINNQSKTPIVVRPNGKTKSSGTTLSPFGKKLVANYQVIKNAQQQFLTEILKDGKINQEILESLGRLGTKLSARNKLIATVNKIEDGAVNSQIYATISGGEEICASITLTSRKNLDIKVGSEIILIFKAPAVIIARDETLNLSSPNIIKGTVQEVKIGAVNAEISLLTKGHQTITSSITKESALNLRLGVGDEVSAVINPSDIIIAM
ncbi:MAG: TOBE domain-containing protein [Campylobacter sp.]|nr:TOBE domain-containing protein [Campylobacter sp.]